MQTKYGGFVDGGLFDDSIKRVYNPVIDYGCDGIEFMPLH